jgi:ATP-binding cassette subfamily G (WHITE) protein 2 (SNQ2)
MIWALRWLTYINVSTLLFVLSRGLIALQPFKYGFDSLMANEFRTINGTCNNLVPKGPGYEGVSLANQVCTTVGALSGEPTVQGSRFLELAYGYSYGHLWRVSPPIFLFSMLLAY